MNEETFLVDQPPDVETPAIVQPNSPVNPSTPDSSSQTPTVTCTGGPTVFTSNMNPRRVIGQVDFVSNLANRGGSVAANTLSKPLGISVINQKIYIADGNNNRVLVYNSIPNIDGADADVVIGQNTMTSSSTGTSANTFFGVQGLSVDTNFLFVGEWSNNRVSFWPLNSLSSMQYVLGQPDMNSNAINNGGVNASGLKNVAGVLRAGNKYIVNDANNNRVLVYDAANLTNQLAAEVVIGQPDFATVTQGSTNNKMKGPLGAASDGQKLIVVDTGNNRLLIYNSIPTTNNATPDLIWGSLGSTSTTLNSPVGAFYDGQKLFVADRSNDRILVFNSLPTSSAQPADIVIGQSTFNSGNHNQCNCSTAAANTLWSAHFLYWDNCRLYVSDSQNNRVLIY